MVKEITQARLGFLKQNVKPNALRLDISIDQFYELLKETNPPFEAYTQVDKFMGMKVNIVEREGWEVNEDAGNLRG